MPFIIFPLLRRVARNFLASPRKASLRLPKHDVLARRQNLDSPRGIDRFRHVALHSFRRHQLHVYGGQGATVSGEETRRADTGPGSALAHPVVPLVLYNSGLSHLFRNTYPLLSTIY